MRIYIIAFIFILSGLLIWFVAVPYYEAQEDDAKPCAPRNLEARCYIYTRENCSTAWEHYEHECRDEAKKTLTTHHSTLLTGPWVRKCTYRRLDQAFHSSRRSLVDPDCQALFKSLDSLNQPQ